MTKLNDLDKAYVAFGIHRFLQRPGIDYLHWQKAIQGGEFEFIQECLEAVKKLEVPGLEDYEGVFVYEICEPLGFMMAKELILDPAVLQQKMLWLFENSYRPFYEEN